MLTLGFSPGTSEGAPACRWLEDGLMVDLMTTEETPFGPVNRRSQVGFETCERYRFEDGLECMILTVPVWMLSKWEVFQNRGESDVLGSRDIKDLVAVMDGRLDADLDEDVRRAPLEVQKALGDMAKTMLAHDDFCRLCLANLDDRKERALNLLQQWATLA